MWNVSTSGVHGRLETGLLQQFRAADNLNNLEGMRQLVESVSMGHSRAYANCIDYVIAQALKVGLNLPDCIALL